MNLFIGYEDYAQSDKSTVANLKTIYTEHSIMQRAPQLNYLRHLLDNNYCEHHKYICINMNKHEYDSGIHSTFSTCVHERFVTSAYNSHYNAVQLGKWFFTSDL